jgi:hypothetical protein
MAGFWSWRYLDIVRAVRLVTSRRVRNFYRDFPHAVPLGSPFPEIELTTTDGRTVDTGRFQSRKHLVLFTGAIT